MGPENRRIRILEPPYTLNMDPVENEPIRYEVSQREPGDPLAKAPCKFFIRLGSKLFKLFNGNLLITNENNDDGKITMPLLFFLFTKINKSTKLYANSAVLKEHQL